MLNRESTQWIGLPLLLAAYVWQGLSHGWLHWGAIAVAVLFLLNLLSLLTTREKP